MRACDRYGDIHPVNTLEEVVCSVVILLGTCFFAYFIGAVSGLLTEGDRVRCAQIRKIEEGQAFCVAQQLPSPLSIRVMRHLRYFWQSTNPFANGREVLGCLPPQLQRNITRHCDSKYFVNQMAIFADLNPYIRGLLALEMKSISCGGGQFLFREGQFGKGLFMQRTGRALIQSRLDDDCHEIGRGAVFGCVCFVLLQTYYADDDFRPRLHRSAATVVGPYVDIL